MKIVRDKSIEEWADTEIMRNFPWKREGLHLSDLMYLRKAFWGRREPRPPTRKEIDYFLSGIAMEDKFLSYIGWEHGEQREWEGILYTPDIFFNFPAEYKTRRRWLPKEDQLEEVYSEYIRQLRWYCAIEKKNQGWLLVLSLVERQDDGSTKPERAFYRCEFSDEELLSSISEILNARRELELALRHKNHTELGQCPAWMCGKVERTMKKKPYCIDCNKEFATDRNLEKHLVGKKTSNHVGEFAEYDYQWEARCRWFDVCEPKI